MPGASTPRRVLVVEDEAAIRELLRLHLELAGFSLEETGDGRHALETARARPFDLILLDVMLPGLDGVSVCRAIRKDGPNQDTPILQTAQLALDRDRREAAVRGEPIELTRTKLTAMRQ